MRTDARLRSRTRSLVRAAAAALTLVAGALPLSGSSASFAEEAAASSRPANATDAAATVSLDARKDVALTVYNQDLGLVREIREFPLASGESVIRYEGVASRIDPRTVSVKSLTDPDKFGVVEQNYVFDLISPEKLMEKYVGQEVQLVESDQNLRTQTTRATLLSVNGGPVYRMPSGEIAVGHPGRVILPSLPGALYARPTLLWRLANRGATRQKVEVSYLTNGISWAADYVAVVNADDSKTDLTGWVTITNQSGARYDDATLKLVAGQVNRAPQPMAMEAAGDVMAMKSAAPPRFNEESFFEYHLYTLDRRATVAENETKQMQLLSAAGVPLKKTFLIVGQNWWYRQRQGDLGHDLPVGVYLEFKNQQAGGLGKPLPAGTIRLYKQDSSGAQQFIGEDAIKHTPKDETVNLKIGDAFDVVATRTQTDYKTINLKPYDVEVAFEVKIRNHKDAPVTVTLREPVGGEWRVVEATHKATKIDAGTIGFEVLVPANGETDVRYRAQIAY
jgi:hypothetical protein